MKQNPNMPREDHQAQSLGIANAREEMHLARLGALRHRLADRLFWLSRSVAMRPYLFSSPHGFTDDGW